MLVTNNDSFSDDTQTVQYIYRRLKTAMDSLALLKISKYLLFGMGEMTVVNWLLQAIIESFPIQFPYCLERAEPHIDFK